MVYEVDIQIIHATYNEGVFTVAKIRVVIDDGRGRKPVI
jgi:hypothetical protein